MKVCQNRVFCLADPRGPGPPGVLAPPVPEEAEEEPEEEDEEEEEVDVLKKI